MQINDHRNDLEQDYEKELEEEKDGNRVDPGNCGFRIIMRKIPKVVTYKDLEKAIRKETYPH